MESRIVKLYQLLDKHIMPWQWDYENYDSDMHGLFYPEDINAVQQIRELEAAGQARRAKEKH